MESDKTHSPPPELKLSENDEGERSFISANIEISDNIPHPKRVILEFERSFGSIYFDSQHIAWELVKREDLLIDDFQSEPSVMEIPVDYMSDEGVYE